MKEAMDAASLLGCSQSEFLVGMEGFCRSLESVATTLEHSGGYSLIDLTHAHHWSHAADVMKAQTEDNVDLCGCGLLKSSPDIKWTYLNTERAGFSPTPLSRDTLMQSCVLDSFTAKLNALHVAVETANLVLDVKYIIQDVN